MELDRPRCGSFLSINLPALRMVQPSHAVSGNGWRKRLITIWPIGRNGLCRTQRFAVPGTKSTVAGGSCSRAHWSSTRPDPCAGRLPFAPSCRQRGAAVMMKPLPQRDSARFPLRGFAFVAGNEHKVATAGPAPVAKFPPRPDPRVLSTSIPLFFIGRNKYGFWVVRAAEGRTGGIFLLKRSALRFAAKNSAPAGCATMFLSEPLRTRRGKPGRRACRRP